MATTKDKANAAAAATVAGRRLCACGCGNPVASAKARLLRGHIRTLEGKVGHALVTGEPLVIYGETVDPAELVRSGQVKASQLPLAAREKLGALGISNGHGTRGTVTPGNKAVNLRPIPADGIKPGTLPGSNGAGIGGEGVTVFGTIPASEVADVAAVVSSKLYGMESLAEASTSPRIQGYAEGYADAWGDIQRLLERFSAS